MDQAGSRGPVAVLTPRPGQAGFCSRVYRVWFSSGDYSLPIRKEYEPHPPSLCVYMGGPSAFAACLKMAVWTVLFFVRNVVALAKTGLSLWKPLATYWQDFWGVLGGHTPKICATETLNCPLTTVFCLSSVMWLAQLQREQARGAFESPGATQGLRRLRMNLRKLRSA